MASLYVGVIVWNKRHRPNESFPTDILTDFCSFVQFSNRNSVVSVCHWFKFIARCLNRLAHSEKLLELCNRSQTCDFVAFEVSGVCQATLTFYSNEWKTVDVWSGRTKCIQISKTLQPCSQNCKLQSLRELEQFAKADENLLHLLNGLNWLQT